MGKPIIELILHNTGCCAEGALGIPPPRDFQSIPSHPVPLQSDICLRRHFFLTYDVLIEPMDHNGWLYCWLSLSIIILRFQFGLKSQMNNAVEPEISLITDQPEKASIIINQMGACRRVRTVDKVTALVVHTPSCYITDLQTGVLNAQETCENLSMYHMLLHKLADWFAQLSRHSALHHRLEDWLQLVFPITSCLLNLPKHSTTIKCLRRWAELRSVKKITQIKSFKPNFTQTKARKLRQI